MTETLTRTYHHALDWFDGLGYDDLFRAPPFLLAAVYFTVFVALTIVQALVARQRGAARWWDFLTVSMVGFFAGWAFYAGALGSNFAGWVEPSADYFTINRLWIGASAIVGLFVAVLALYRSTRELVGLVRNPVTHNRVTFDLPAGVRPEVRVEPIRDQEDADDGHA